MHKNHYNPIYRRARPIIKYSLDGKELEAYNSTTIAGLKNRIDVSHIAACARWEEITAWGFKWGYVPENRLHLFARKKETYGFPRKKPSTNP